MSAGSSQMLPKKDMRPTKSYDPTVVFHSLAATVETGYQMYSIVIEFTEQTEST